jgi:hypothetical protein
MRLSVLTNMLIRIQLTHIPSQVPVEPMPPHKTARAS